jgi:hypothetical protein
VTKSIGVIMLIFSALVRAETATPLDTGDAFKRALEQFKPGEALSGFTSNPPEASLNPTENNDGLKNQGLANVHKNETSELIYTEGKTRTKVIANPNNPEMQYAEHLIEGSDSTCTDGSCDTTKNKESHDMNEGVSRLGALAGVAGEVSTNQIAEGMAKIFAGSVIDCKSYPLGFRDCCTDSGWGDWVKHCPSDMQVLQKAKDENRVVSLGKYRKHKLDLDYHHVYCVFPSKLSAIIQKEGRNAQLHIPFGKAKSPDCRGITPQELGHINFDKLNLSPIEQELMSRLHVPDAGMASNLNQAHIERLHQEGRAHD